MRGWKRGVPSPGTVLGGLALIVATGGVAVAAIPDATGTFKGCVNADGYLQVLDTAVQSSCSNQGDRAISWNQQGPQGAVGPQGATGPQGPQGVPGPQGASGTIGSSVYRVSPKLTVKFYKNRSDTEYCSSNEVRLGGGYKLTDVDNHDSTHYISVTENRPSDSGQGWTVRVENQSAETVGFKAYVVCGTKG